MKTKHDWTPWIYVGPITVIGTESPVGVLLVRKCSITQDVEFLEQKHTVLDVPLEEYKKFFENLYSNRPSGPKSPNQVPR